MDKFAWYMCLNDMDKFAWYMCLNEYLCMHIDWRWYSRFYGLTLFKGRVTYLWGVLIKSKFYFKVVISKRGDC